MKCGHVRNYSGRFRAISTFASDFERRLCVAVMRRANDCSGGNPQATIRDVLMQVSAGCRCAIRLSFFLVFWFLASPFPAVAQRTEASQPVRAKAVLQATVTTQGNIPLGGMVVSVVRDGTEVASSATDGEGKVTFDQLEPGAYAIRVAAQGFDPLTTNVTVSAVSPTVVALDLRIAA